jgi:hypothetical protein
MFVNERLIDDNNWEKYGLPAIEQRVLEFTRPSTCTVDCERNIHVIMVAKQVKAEHIPTGLYGWFLSWYGHELWAEINVFEAKGKRGEPCCARFLLTKLCLMSEKDDWMGRSKKDLPPELKPHRGKILKDFHDALVVHKGIGGIGSAHTTYELILELAEGV